MRILTTVSVATVTFGAATICFAQGPAPTPPPAGTPATETGAAAPTAPPTTDAAALEAAAAAAAPKPNAGAAAPFADNAKAKAIYQDSKERVQKQIDDLLEVPETPAAFALGLSADVVARPTTLREATGSIKTIIGADGKLIPGAAIEVAPLYATFTRDKTVEQWKADWFQTFLSSFRISVATASDPKAADPDNAPTLLAVGARLGYDGTDPRYHAHAVEKLEEGLAKCAADRETNLFKDTNEGEAASVMKPECAFGKLEEEVVSSLSGLRFELAGTTIYADRAGATDAETNYRGWQGWLASEYRFSGDTGVGLGVDYRLDVVPGPNPNAFRAGARFNRESDLFTVSLAGAYATRTASTDDTERDNWLDVGATLAAKINDTAALSLGAQWQKNIDRDQSDLIILLAITNSAGEPVFERHVPVAPK